MILTDYLKASEETMPQWLKDYTPGDKVDFKTFMSSRIGYYPGSGYDGNLVAVCCKSHSVHCFLYVDYKVRKMELKETLYFGREGFRGYHSIGSVNWKERELMPNGQYPLNVPMPDGINPSSGVLEGEKPYIFMEVMERDSNYDDSWGPERFAIAFLFADGIATFYQLFAREYKKAPWIMLLQDHGFGGNYDKFGKDGLLDSIITKNNVRPEYVLCAENTHMWDGYVAVEGVDPTSGGMHNHKRYIYKKQ